jgi:hypothetical protein
MTDQAAAPTPTILQSLQEATNPGQEQQQPSVVGFSGPQGNLYDSGKARVPAPQVPMRPAGQPEDTDDAPDVHPVDAMASAFIDHLISKDKGPAAPQQEKQDTGSFGDKLAGALGAVGSGLGDMRTGGDPGKGHGWLSAVGATLNARNERMDREKQQDFEKQERLKADQINLAQANMNTVKHARDLQLQDKVIRDAAASSFSHFVDSARDNFKVQDHISHSELMDEMKDPEFARNHTAGIAGYDTVLDAEGKPQLDSKGLPVEMPYYSIINVGAGDMKNQYTVPADISKKWADAGLKNIPAGTLMPMSAATKLNSQAEKYGTTLSLLDMGKVAPLPDAVKDQLVSALKDPEVQHAVASNPGSPLAGLYEAQNNIGDHLMQADSMLDAAKASGNPQAIQAAQENVQNLKTIQQNVDQTINSGFTDAERATYAKEKVAQQKADATEQHNIDRDAETKRHNIAEEQIKAAESMSSPEAVNAAADMLLNADEDPSQLSKRAKGYQPTMDAAAAKSWAQYGKPWSPADAAGEYKFATAKGTVDTLNYLTSLTGGPNVPGGGNLGELVKKSNQINRTEFPPLNDKLAWARLKTGDPAMAEYQTVVTEVADQVAKILQGGSGGGGTSDAKLHQAQELFDKGFTKDQIKGVANELLPLLNNRQKGMIGNNRYLQRKYYGPQGLTTTIVAPTGQKIEVRQDQLASALQKGAHIQTKDEYYQSLPTAKQ